MPIKHQVTIPVWLELKPETRQKLKDIFGIVRSGNLAFVQQGGKGVQTSDGHTHGDLSVITLETMASYLGEPISDDFWKTFDKVVDKVEGKTTVPVVDTVGHVEKVEVIDKGPFCDTCDSLGGRHKRACPKNAK